ncbi:MAG TPA: DUF3429 domain-containing protein [Acetobacteraceae bacterium]|jgi:hypothetical protein
MPASAILLSILGLAPFIGCGLAALGSDMATAGRMLTALIAWGALVLAFTGGVHWGLVLREPATEPLAASGSKPGIGRHTRIGLAAVPLILGWLALLLPLVAAEWLALLALIVAYIAALVAEHHSSRRIVLPSRYLWLRWGFTVVAVAMLTTVLTLRLLGQTIVL